MRLFERGLDAFTTRPVRYTLGFLIVLASVFSTYAGDINVFGFAVQREYWVLGYFLWSLLWQAKSQGAIVFAIAILTTCPFLIILEQPTLAEQAAVSVFYFLVIGVIEQMVEYIRDTRAETKTLSRRRRPDGAEEQETSVEGQAALVESWGAEIEDGLEVTTRADKRSSEKGRRGPVIYGLSAAIVVAVILGAVWLIYPKKTTISNNQAKTAVSKSAAFKPSKTKAGNSGKITPPPVAPAAAVVVVVNANGIEDEATLTSKLLTAAGYSIGSLGTADSEEPVTRIYYVAGRRQAAEAVAAVLKDRYPAEYVEGGYGSYSGDIIVVLGLDKIK